MTADHRRELTMAKPKTLIIYALAASVADITTSIAEARERGQPVRLIALEEFRGETEQNAGAVYVERSDEDELVFDRIQQAYPLIEVQDYDGDLNLDKWATFEPKPQEDDLVELRLQLIKLGGSAPAGADAAELANLIAAQRAEQRHHPILPNPATQGTVIPDATPIVQRSDGDKLIDENAVGTGPAGLKAAEKVAGEGPSGGGTASHSASATIAKDDDDTKAPTKAGGAKQKAK